MKNTKTKTELLQTIRKWEDLCDESLADAAYWKGQAKSIPDLIEALEDAAFLMRMAAKIAGPMQDSFKRSAEDAAKALAKAEGNA